MTHEDQSTCFAELFQLLSDNGFEGMAEAIEILMNEAMKIERAEVLGATPYQRTETRRGYANRSITGSMNELIRYTEWWLIEGVSPHDVSFRLNDTLMSASATKESQGYGRPREAFKLLANEGGQRDDSGRSPE